MTPIETVYSSVLSDS